jgi:hypothetical protein
MILRQVLTYLRLIFIARKIILNDFAPGANLFKINFY